MDDTVKLTANIAGVGKREISFDAQELLSQIKVEYLMAECPEHTVEEAQSSIDFNCENCKGSGYALEPFGKVLAELFKRQEIVLSKSSWNRNRAKSQ